MSNTTDLYLDNHPIWGVGYITAANNESSGDSAYFNSSWNDGAYTFNPYAPEVALANFLIFQYVNDYVSNDGVAPNWYAELTLMGYADGNAMFTAIDPNWRMSYDALNWSWAGGRVRVLYNCCSTVLAGCSACLRRFAGIRSVLSR